MIEQYEQEIRKMDDDAFRAKCVSAIVASVETARDRGRLGDQAWLRLRACQEEHHRRWPYGQADWQALQDQAKARRKGKAG